MPKCYSSNHILRILRNKGFVSISQKGSHIKLRKENIITIVPANKKSVPVGTFKAIVRQSKLKDIDFI